MVLFAFELWITIFLFALIESQPFVWDNLALPFSGIKLYRAGTLITLVLFCLLSFRKKKVRISAEGIYIYRYNLQISWEELEAVHYMWLFERSTRSRLWLYSSKSLVIFRKHAKPICIRNVSYAALWAVHVYVPGVPNNLGAAGIATVYNFFCNCMILFGAYNLNMVNHIPNSSACAFVVTVAVLACLRTFAVPFLPNRNIFAQRYRYLSGLHTFMNKQYAGDVLEDL